ncbi:MAG: hypothetical protein M1823_000577 [Watsoniomyces obsoletus]|nr:MAG: hypothetical protein M1823_000577 [Watsoniomyces obsoletus]
MRLSTVVVCLVAAAAAAPIAEPQEPGEQPRQVERPKLKSEKNLNPNIGGGGNTPGTTPQQLPLPIPDGIGTPEVNTPPNTPSTPLTPGSNVEVPTPETAAKNVQVNKGGRQTGFGSRFSNNGQGNAPVTNVAKQGNPFEKLGEWWASRGNKNQGNQQQTVAAEPGTTAPEGSNPVQGVSGKVPEVNTPASKPKFLSRISGAANRQLANMKEAPANVIKSAQSKAGGLKADAGFRLKVLSLQGKLAGDRVKWAAQDLGRVVVPQGVRNFAGRAVTATKNLVVSKLPESLRNKFSPPNLDGAGAAGLVDDVTPSTAGQPALNPDMLAMKPKVSYHDRVREARLKHNARPLSEVEKQQWKKYLDLYDERKITTITEGGVNPHEIKDDPAGKRDLMGRERNAKFSTALHKRILDGCMKLEGNSRLKRVIQGGKIGTERVWTSKDHEKKCRDLANSKSWTKPLLEKLPEEEATVATGSGQRTKEAPVPLSETAEKQIKQVEETLAVGGSNLKIVGDQMAKGAQNPGGAIVPLAIGIGAAVASGGRVPVRGGRVLAGP